MRTQKQLCAATARHVQEDVVAAQESAFLDPVILSKIRLRPTAVPD
jgi:hypothetical protein